MLQSEVALAGLVRNLVLPVGLAIALPMVIANSALAERRPGDGQLASRSEPVTVLELSRSAKRVRVIRDNQEVAAFPVAVGKSSTPTPLGEHTVFRMQKDPVWVSPWTDRKVSPSPLDPSAPVGLVFGMPAVIAPPSTSIHPPIGLRFARKSASMAPADWPALALPPATVACAWLIVMRLPSTNW